jgi:hypothetical protein
MSRTKPGTLRSRAYAQARSRINAAAGCLAAPPTGLPTKDAAEIMPSYVSSKAGSRPSGEFTSSGTKRYLEYPVLLLAR